MPIGVAASHNSGRANSFTNQTTRNKTWMYYSGTWKSGIRLVVDCLCNDALSVTRLYSFDDRISEWWWIWKDLVGSGQGLTLRYHPSISLEGLRKTTKTLNKDSRSPGPRIEPGTSRIRSRSANHSTTSFGVRDKNFYYIISFEELLTNISIRKFCFPLRTSVLMAYS
jgi:hypothetical protein